MNKKGSNPPPPEGKRPDPPPRPPPKVEDRCTCKNSKCPNCGVTFKNTRI